MRRNRCAVPTTNYLPIDMNDATGTASVENDCMITNIGTINTVKTDRNGLSEVTSTMAQSSQRYKVFLKHGVTQWAALSALSLKTIFICQPLDGFEEKGKTILKEPIATKKRENYIDWKTYFMATAFLARQRSKDPHYQVGACIVDDDKKIVGIGWNGRPTGVSDDAFTWGKGEETLDNKHTYVCHAEANAITFRTTVNVKGCTLYVTLLPCNECAKIIIQSGIKKVYYFCEDKTSDKFKATKPMFEKADVKYKEFKPKIGKIDLTFSSENLSNK